MTQCKVKRNIITSRAASIIEGSLKSAAQMTWRLCSRITAEGLGQRRKGHRFSLTSVTFFNGAGHNTTEYLILYTYLAFCNVIDFIGVGGNV